MNILTCKVLEGWILTQLMWKLHQAYDVRFQGYDGLNGGTSSTTQYPTRKNPKQRTWPSGALPLTESWLTIETHKPHGLFQSVSVGLMCQLLCGIHSLFQVDTFNLYHFVPYSVIMWWNAWVVHCELPYCHTISMMQHLLTRGHYSFRTPIVICELHGPFFATFHGMFALNCIFESVKPKTLDQRPNLNRSLNQSNRTQTENYFRLSNLQLRMWSLWWIKHLGLIVWPWIIALACETKLRC